MKPAKRSKRMSRRDLLQSTAGLAVGGALAGEGPARADPAPARPNVYEAIGVKTVINATGRNLAVVVNQAVEQNKFTAGAAPAAKVETPKAEAAAEAKAEVDETAAHVEESQAGEQPSGAAQPENSTASQAGEAASEPVGE